MLSSQEVKATLDDAQTRLENRITLAWISAERTAVKVAKEWSKDFPNHFVSVDEGMGQVFLEVNCIHNLDRVIRITCQDICSRDVDFVGVSDSSMEMVTVMVEPLIALRAALVSMSDAYRCSLDFHCFYRGVRRSKVWYLQHTRPM